VEGGYLWSPKKKQGGGNNEAYNNMTRTLIGDCVFSFAGGEIRAVGIVVGQVQEAPQPAEFGDGGVALWGVDPGWQLPVRFELLKSPLRVKPQAKVLEKVLPTRHSPIRASGDGNQNVYLAAIPPPVVEAIRGLLGGQLEVAQAAIESEAGGELEAEAVEAAIAQRLDIGPTEKMRLSKARLGQGVYRTNLEQIERSCRVTGISHREFLRASHIKPWAKSDDLEKLDGHNGLLLAPQAPR